METDECGRPTVEHKLPLAPQWAAPTCKIFQSAGFGATFVKAIQLLPGLSGLLSAYKYDNFHMQSYFSNRFMDPVTGENSKPYACGQLWKKNALYLLIELAV